MFTKITAHRQNRIIISLYFNKETGNIHDHCSPVGLSSCIISTNLLCVRLILDLFNLFTSVMSVGRFRWFITARSITLRSFDVPPFSPISDPELIDAHMTHPDRYVVRPGLRGHRQRDITTSEPK